MTDDSAPAAAAAADEQQPKPQSVRPRLVFDDPLSRPSRDDTDTGWGGGEESGGRDEAWYRRETPPHHGD
ncbi:hypothetical protein [Streptacidiphilus carbonis]|jgi:hypothetical protein|uniref:hypothetical protein n=1 Tax=Streptacidiphilus carbonis TaxID=105422 RepID=UPI0005A8DD5B|nr:hypothetical protein [Streptacidiphilus carbonis]